jgi:hypothetical protein
MLTRLSKVSVLMFLLVVSACKSPPPVQSQRPEPESKEGMWSKEVIALTDTGDVFKLSCMGSYWQRTKAFIDSGASKVTHWMPLNYPDD